MTPPVIILVGNVGSLHSTEAAYRSAYFSLGCEVLSFSQDECGQRGQNWIYDRAMEAGAVMLQYDRTHSGTALTPDWTALWRRLESEGCATVGAHLDVYWGIPEREGWIRSGDAQFTVGTLFTADGGSDEQWKAAGVNHRWLPAGYDTRFLVRPEPIADLVGKIVFVGSSRGYHPCYPQRDQLLDFARAQWPDRLVEYGNGTPNGSVRGANLCHIYASDCIVLGDSCFAGQRANYWSDRVPETLGRGGLLLHPKIEGMEKMYEYGADLLTYTAGDFVDLVEAVDEATGWGEGYRHRIRNNGRYVTSMRDSYQDRAREVLTTVGIEVDCD